MKTTQYLIVGAIAIGAAMLVHYLVAQGMMNFLLPSTETAPAAAAANG